jgi:hypothetical protein
VERLCNVLRALEIFSRRHESQKDAEFHQRE